MTFSVLIEMLNLKVRNGSFPLRVECAGRVFRFLLSRLRLPVGDFLRAGNAL